jgi:fatty-acyl-CoA synthase
VSEIGCTADELNQWCAASVGSVLLDGARVHPDRPALQWMSNSELASLTYRELCVAAATGARTMGEPESRQPVAVLAPNCVAWYVLFRAAALAGRPLVPLNPSLTAAEAGALIADSGATMVLASASYRGRGLLDESRSACGATSVLDLDDWLDDILADPVGRAATTAEDAVAPSEPFLIQYTSGSTGTPKGAILSHQVCLNAARTIAAQIAPTDHEIWCSPMPLHHVGGSLALALAPATMGGTFVMVAEFSAEAFVEAAVRSGATLLGGVPTLYLRIMESPELASAAMPALRTLLLGGASVPPPLVMKMEEHFGVGVLVMYGQSEAPAISATRPDDAALVKAQTVGRPLAHGEIRIVDVASGAELGVDEVGEIWVRTQARMDGYLNRPEETSATLDAQGWVHTGDLGSLDVDGLLHLRGRFKEMIVRGGENIYAREVEIAIESHPDVSQVAVVGLPDERWGEIVAAAVVVRADAAVDVAGLKSHIAERLAPFKWPTRWDFVDALPMTASGKPQKFKIVGSLVANTKTNSTTPQARRISRSVSRMQPEQPGDLAGRGRPRDPSTEERVFAGARQELAERGFEAFSMRSVARRSGVARPSLLLRWPTRDALILDTLERLVEWPRPDPKASVRAEIDAIVARVGELLKHDMLAIQLRLIADAPRHPALFAAFQDTVMSKAGRRLTRLLQKAVTDGELPATTDIRWAADALIGGMFMRTIRSPGQSPPSAAAQRQIVDAFWTTLTLADR